MSWRHKSQGISSHGIYYVEFNQFGPRMLRVKSIWFCPFPKACVIHLPLVPHICICELGQHWFRWWLVACSAPSHYLNQCWLIVNWTLRHNFQWNVNQNTKLIIHENAFENIVCEMTAILSRGRWVNWSSEMLLLFHQWQQSFPNESCAVIG